jgi:hypothetical protein
MSQANTRTKGIRTSSTREGKILRIRSPWENLSKTVVSPFINDIFSSLVFEVKLDRSKKLSVEIGKDEKNGYDGNVDGVGRLSACRVIKDRKRARGLLGSILVSMSKGITLKIRI